jgi:hypothetical protein
MKVKKSAYSYFKRLKRDNVVLVYLGTMSSGFMDSFLETVETRMAELDETRRVKKKVFNVLVESLQNIYHHTDDIKDSDYLGNEVNLGEAIVVVSRDVDHYSIITGNFFASEHIPSMQRRIRNLNRMEKGELRSFYKQVLENGTYSTKGTAGLGFIDIIRKSGQPLRARFDTTNDRYCFATLETRIPRLEVQAN